MFEEEKSLEPENHPSAKDLTHIHFDARANNYWKDNYATVPSNHHALLLQRRREAVIELVGAQEGRTILELGCGPGVFIFDLSNALRYIVADLSAPMVQAAMDRGKNAIVGGVQSTTEKLPFATNSFDLVIAAGVLEYLPEIRPSLFEIYRILRVGGVAVISFPSPQPWGNTLRWLGRPIEPIVRAALGRDLSLHDQIRRGMSHRQYWPHTIKQVFTSVGFSIDQCINFHYFYFPFDALFYSVSKKIDYLIEQIALTAPVLHALSQTHLWRIRKIC